MTTTKPTRIELHVPEGGDTATLLQQLYLAGVDVTGSVAAKDGWQAFLGDLAGVQASAPLLLTMLRTIILARPEDRLMPFMVARVWLTTHCNACGRVLPDELHSFATPPYCAPCQGAIDAEAPALTMTEQLVIDRQRLQALLNDPALDERDRSQLYLLSAGGALTAAARAGHAAQGRGAVVVSMVGETQIYYVPDAMVRDKQQHWPTDQVGDWVRDYDPNDQMIVIISRPSGVEAFKVRLAPAEVGAESFMAGPARKVSAA
jgi:hypothetical protein